jgi:hypothetical protein
MAGFRIEITNSLGEVVERIESAITQCSDFTPMWTALREPWERSRRIMYQTLGRSNNTPWPKVEDTDEAEWYVWYKAAVLDLRIERPSDLNRLILRWIGDERLYPSVTNTRHRLAIWRPEPLALAMGTRAPGARNNDQGIGKAPEFMGGHEIPRRSLLTFGPAFAKDTGKALGNLAGDISRALGDRSRVRAGLTTASVMARLTQRRLL